VKALEVLRAKMSNPDLLLKDLRACLEPSAIGWLDDAMAQAATGTLPQLLRRYTEATRALGAAPLKGVSAVGFGPDWTGVSLERWTVADGGRALMLLARAGGAMGGSFAADATACYENGDAGEQQSWMRAVALLPGARGFLPLVIDTCRTNILPLFESVACENPYPSRYFPELNFNQLVLKALFNGVALARIVGLDSRANDSLARMANDYAAERRAAGRSVPADLGLATTGAHRTS
jgi:hypothetical protein